MFVKNLNDCKSFIANDGCTIQELLHPSKDPVGLPYSIAIATLELNRQSYAHKLAQDEVYYILQGQGCMHIDDESRIVKHGDVIMIPSGSSQWIENKGEVELIFVAIVNPPWTEEGDTRI